MAVRQLPGAYVTLNDLSFFPEGDTSLTVGYVLKANKGPVNEARLVTNPTDFLTKYAFASVPTIKDDPTFWSILKVLTRTNTMYVVRAANNPLYGGAKIKKEVVLGKLESAHKDHQNFVILSEEEPAQVNKIYIDGTNVIDGYYTVNEIKPQTGSSNKYVIEVNEAIEKDFTPTTDVLVRALPIEPLTESISSLDSVDNYLTDDTIMLITGVDPGAYNGELAFDIISWKDNSSLLVYENTMQLNVRVAATGELLESYTFSRDPLAKAIDGTSLFVDNVVAGSAYIKIFNNANIPATELPTSTITSKPIQAGAGSNGGEVTEDTLGTALDAFADKTIPISILGNGCSDEAESKKFQQAMLELADKRKDLVVFLNNPINTEAAALGDDKATDIVNYKKDLGSTSYYGAMYVPHVNTSDTFNSRSVKIGCDAVAIAGWLNVINNLNYPYAYAGPQNGLVTGVTTDWKIGDESGAAQTLNDASVNYIAYDGKVGRYYMQCQNTLQVANSALRNIGGVLNVLDIKEHLATALKEYGQLPITAVLRRDILNTIRNYLDPMTGTRFYNYAFEDVTTDADIAQDTLRYLLYISLTRYANRLICFINVVNSTFDFSIIQSA